MVLRWLGCVVVIGTVSGCFNPQVKNFGFACNVNDVSPCPAGFQCINGYCDDGSGGKNPGTSGGGVDMSAPAIDMAQAQPPATFDMAHAQQSIDMAQPITSVDMAQPNPPDMLMCGGDGAHCTSYKDCCSGHCHSLTTLVCYTPGP
jgi:hypothetical protein